MQNTTNDLSFLLKEPDTDYHAQAKNNLSSHQLAEFRKCPAMYLKRRQGLIEDVDRPAYFIGRAAHTLILEGREAFEKAYAFGGPINPKTNAPYGPATKKYAEWEAQQGKPGLTDDSVKLVVKQANAVRSHDGARLLLSEGVAEGVLRTDYCGMPSQIRVDFLNPRAGIVDLKTCDDLTWFEADARRYGYAYQLAFYRAVLAKAVHTLLPVHMIAVEKKEPFRCGVWQIADSTLSYATKENEAAIKRLKDCHAKGLFPTGYEECRVFDSI